MYTSPSPALIAWKGLRVVCSDDEQYRVDGWCAVQVIVAEQPDRHHARHVEALLAAGQPAAKTKVAPLGRIEPAGTSLVVPAPPGTIWAGQGVRRGRMAVSVALCPRAGNGAILAQGLERE